MTYSEFKSSVNLPEPPPVSPLLQALWYDAKGDWSKAHQIAQDIDSPEGAWVHGYLHLREGDRANAGYWYNRAGQSLPAADLAAEWGRIANKLL